MARARGARGAYGLAALALAALVAPGALAQSMGGNEAWLGQVGGLNVLDITQEGRGNKAGADYVFLLLGQDGVGNSLTLNQYGYDNELGTLFALVPNYARGVWQRGDRNVIDIIQFNGGAQGANMLGSIQQSSRYNLPSGSGAFNSLSVTQTSVGDATGYGGHYIGRVVQTMTGSAGVSGNTVSIVQRGGGLDEGNVLANIHQRGNGNSFATLQSGDLNRIGEQPRAVGLPIGGIIQFGTRNSGWLIQQGTQNLVEYLRQYGDRNVAHVRLSGSGNTISQIYQHNESWQAAGAGNRVSINVTGDDNGGSGAGWVGEFLQVPSLATPGIAHGVFQQIGDANDMSLVVLSGLETKYGMSQIGDGNDAHVAIAGATYGGTAANNETAVFQYGDANYLTHTVNGSNSTGAFRQRGNGNFIATTQRGTFSTARITIEGNDNNRGTSSLFGPALDLRNSVSGVTLGRGRVVQEGLGGTVLEANLVALDVVGSSNAFTFYQSGSANTAQGTITGSDNALAVVQRNLGSTALLNQSGGSNSLAIHQF